MIAVFLLLNAAFAQDGVRVFQQSCAVGYCHGTAGSANRAPRLAGRSFDRAFLQRVVESGVPKTAMPGFKGKLPDADLAAVVDYVLTLGSGAAAPAASAATTASSTPVQVNMPGKDLFFDPVRGTRCGTCHLLEGMGTAVGPNLAALANATAGAIQNATSAHVQTATAGDRFPALVVESKDGWVKLYDLTATPPVLRTLAAGRVSLSAGTWSHAAAIASYKSDELEQIAAYLRTLASR